MIEFEKEYFNKPYYFFLKDRGNKISLHYSVSENLNEAKKEDNKMDFPKKEEKNVKNFISKTLKDSRKISLDSITKNLKKLVSSTKDEVVETKLLGKILSKSITSFVKGGDFKLDKEDVDFIKSQSKDILKLIPIIVFQLVPGSTIATPFIISLADKAGIRLNSKIPEKYKKKEKEGGELDEFVDADGSFSSSNIPILDMGQHTQWTQDQRAALIRNATGMFPQRARIFYGESKENKTPLEEENYSDTYGYAEMENVNSFNECLEVFEELGVKDPFERYERCMSFGYDPELDVELKQEKKHGECEDCDVKMRINELRKDKMKKMIDEILLDKKKKSEDVVKKDSDEDDESPISKILLRNIESIKKIAEKEGIDLNKLIKHLKEGE
jgi:hypothetical protein